MALIMSDTGHALHAEAMKANTFFLAWGVRPDDYPDEVPWEVDDTPPVSNSSLHTKTLTKGTAGGLDAIGETSIISLVSIKIGSTQYYLDQDFVLSGTDVDWSPGGDEPSEGSTYDLIYRTYNDALTSLLEEIGRHSCTIKEYVEKDDNGDISANDQNWSIVGYVTRYLYMQFKFDAEDAFSSVIRQIGLYVNCTRAEGVPEGKIYLIPDEVDEQGTLYMIENIVPTARAAGKREIFEFVITY